jgi:RHS repeat-associated protein
VSGRLEALPFGFGGKRYEPETGLYDNRARFYDPSSGRFTQPDPLGSIDSLNHYQFVRNNPLVYVDTLGHSSQKNAQGRIAASSDAVPSGKVYSVLFEMTLPATSWGRSDYIHFKLANEAFIQALKASPSYRATVSQLMPNPIQQTERAIQRHGAPGDWVWHHHSMWAGVMDLVPKSQHTSGSVFWKTLHPENKGGYKNWATPAGAPPR